MTKPKEMILLTFSGLTVFILVTLRYFLIFFNVIFLLLLVLASISLIVFLIWINI